MAVPAGGYISGCGSLACLHNPGEPDSHGRRQLEPLSRDTWRQGPAGGGSTQKGGAWEEKWAELSVPNPDTSP